MGQEESQAEAQMHSMIFDRFMLCLAWSHFRSIADDVFRGITSIKLVF